MSTANGHTVQRFRQCAVTFPGPTYDRLVADHRGVVADAISRGEAAPSFDDFLIILLDFGRRAVMQSTVPTDSANKEAT